MSKGGKKQQQGKTGNTNPNMQGSQPNKEESVINLAAEKEVFEEELAKKSELDKIAEGLILRERALMVKEEEAKAGFAKEHEEAVRESNKKREALQKELEKLAEEKQKRTAEIDARLDAYYKEQQNKNEKKCQSMLDEYEKMCKMKLEACEKMCKESIENTEKTCKTRLEECEKTYRTKIKEIDALCDEKLLRMNMEIEKRTSEMDEREQSLNKQKEEVAQKVTELNREKIQLHMREEELEELKAHCEEMSKTMYKHLIDKLRMENALLTRKSEMLTQKQGAYDELIDKLGGREPREILGEINDLKNRMQELREKTYSDSRIADLEEKEEEFLVMKETAERYKEMVERLREETVSKVEHLALKADYANAKQLYEDSKNSLEGMLEYYKMTYETKKTNRTDRMKGITEGYQIQVLNKLAFEVNETAWLDDILKKCGESGIYFSKRILYSFHTALKTSEISTLTVLSGVSGTGKSELPKLYARFGGMSFLMLSVQPDWDSPNALFGFFNSIDNKFNATELIRAMYQFSKGDYQDTMLLVLMDEMNLASVELYFSEMLSRLEARRGLKEDENEYIHVDLGAGEAKLELPLTRNILWTGTVNQDETTKTLSDKVIDRSNLINFPRPEKLYSRQNVSLLDKGPLLSNSTWRAWINARKKLDGEIEPFKDIIEEINKKLAFVNRALGHRVWQSIENYMANHPLVIRAYNYSGEKESEDKKQLALNFAFEEALVHKVMPKLRGIELEGDSRDICLEPISEILDGYSIKKDFQKTLENLSGVFDWCSSTYLTEIPDNEYEV